MRRGWFAFLALAAWPAWAQGPAGTAPPSLPSRQEQPDRATMRFEWVREGGECRDRCRAFIAATGRITETTHADFEARMGPAGLSQGFREMAAACPK